jgi:hypothetical protein
MLRPMCGCKYCLSRRRQDSGGPEKLHHFLRVGEVDRFAWFDDVLSRIVDHPFTKLDELRPHRWAAVYCSPSSSGGFTRMKI